MVPTTCGDCVSCAEEGYFRVHGVTCWEKYIKCGMGIILESLCDSSYLSLRSEERFPRPPS